MNQMSDETELLEAYAGQFHETYLHLKKNPLITDENKIELLQSFALYLFKSTKAGEADCDISLYDDHSAILMPRALAELIQDILREYVHEKETKPVSI